MKLLNLKIKKNLGRSFFVLALCFCSFFWANQARAATLYLSPASGSYHIGDTFEVFVFVNSSDQAMNAAKAVINFSKDKLEAISVATKDSIFALLVGNPTFSNSAGTAQFSGVILTPGYDGSKGQLATIIFRAKSEGRAYVSIGDSQVLANDGDGTDILNAKTGAVFNILPARAIPPILKTEIQTSTTEITPSTTTEQPPSEPSEPSVVTIVQEKICPTMVFPYLFLRIGNNTFLWPDILLFLILLLTAIAIIISLKVFFKSRQEHGDKIQNLSKNKK